MLPFKAKQCGNEDQGKAKQKKIMLFAYIEIILHCPLRLKCLSVI